MTYQPMRLAHGVRCRNYGRRTCAGGRSNTYDVNLHHHNIIGDRRNAPATRKVEPTSKRTQGTLSEATYVTCRQSVSNRTSFSQYQIPRVTASFAAAIHAGTFPRRPRRRPGGVLVWPWRAGSVSMVTSSAFICYTT